MGEVHDPARRAVVADGVDLARGQSRIDQDRPGADTCDGEEQRDQCGAVFADDEHAIARTCAGRGKALRGRGDRRGEFRISPCAVPLAKCIGHRHSRGLQRHNLIDARGRPGQQARDVLERDVAHFAASRIMLRAMTSCWIWLVPS